MTANRYFALEEPEIKANTILSKIQSWTDSVVTSNYLDKCKTSWMAYYGIKNSAADSHKITFGGEQGELVKLAVNHYRNIATNLINMTVSNRPAVEAQAINTDYKSQTQTILANGLLDYYMYQKRLEDYLRQAVEGAVVLNEGYVRLAWNNQAGDPYFKNEETGETLYNGDIEFSNLDPLAVTRDASREDVYSDWYAVTTYKNRYDLAAKYPQHAEEILKVPSKDRDMNSLGYSLFNEESDLIPVREFFHQKTEAMKGGNYMIFVSPKAVFYDGPLPYRTIPIYRMSVSNIMGTPFGYSPLLDLLPIQEAIDSLYSTVLTNQSAFGVQNIAVPKGSDLNIQAISGGLNLVEYDKDEGPPVALNLTNTPVEIFNFIKMLETAMETLSGINSVVRGNPEASLRTGNALALVQAQAVQFASGLQQAYIKLLEDTCTGIVQIIQDYANEPRIAVISGKANRTYLKEFKGKDLDNVNRVIVKASNPLQKTIGGKLEIAKNLQDMGFIKTPEQYFTVLTTGKLESMYEGELAELMLIKQENEMMLDGNLPPIYDIDQHLIHINEHKALLADPYIRGNSQLAQIVRTHMAAHVEQLKTADPYLLQLTGQQPIMVPPEQGQPNQTPPATGQQSAGAAGNVNMATEMPLPGTDVAAGVGMPTMPQSPSGQPVSAEEQMALNTQN